MTWKDASIAVWAVNTLLFGELCLDIDSMQGWVSAIFKYVSAGIFGVSVAMFVKRVREL